MEMVVPDPRFAGRQRHFDRRNYSDSYSVRTASDTSCVNASCDNENEHLFSKGSDKLRTMMKRMFASIGGSVRPIILWSQRLASKELQDQARKIRIII